jgi:formate dehydrogenase maturation protein FdhE
MDSPSRWVPRDFGARWEHRINRAQDLRVQHPNVADPLRFYQGVLQFQLELARDFNSAVRSGVGLHEQIDPTIAVRKFPNLLALACESGLDPLSHRAGILMEAGENRWGSILESALAGDRDDSDFLNSFFARVCLQPAAENLQAQVPLDADYGQSICPICASAPQLSILRAEGDGAARWLLCSFCLREWRFRRIACPCCAEEDKEKLPRYSAEGYSYVNVEACDRCKTYLKNVDMTIEGRAVPLVDEMALAVLDVWASDHGYTKIIPNLIGL